MSLICDETGRKIEYGEVLMAGTRGDVEFFSALSYEVIKRIPLSKRRQMSCRRCDGGVDIHEASSPRNFNGAYAITGFTLGRFLFSVSAEAAAKYLPKHSRRYAVVSRA